MKTCQRCKAKPIWVGTQNGPRNYWQMYCAECQKIHDSKTQELIKKYGHLKMPEFIKRCKNG